MFGFSLFKIIFTIVIVIVVWNGFKYFTRMQDQRADRSRMKSQGKGRNKASGNASAPQPGTEGIEDMVECKVCNAYVTRGAKSCGRDDCPFMG